MFKDRKITIYVILFFGLIFGLISIFFWGDKLLDNEWGIMLNIFEKENIMSIRRVGEEHVPNIFMPPMYLFFLFIVKKFLFGLDILVIIVQLIQLFFFLLSVVIMNKILLSFFSNKLANIGTFIFTFFPLNLYAIGQTSSITVQVFFITSFMYFFIKIYEVYSFKNVVLFSISTGFLMLLRGEFFIFFFFSLFYLFLKRKNFKSIILSILVTSLIISPYLWRNYKIFNVLTITKSSGFNLLKGNNPLSNVEGVPLSAEAYEIMPIVPGLEEEINNVGVVKNYDLLLDKIFLNKAINFIKKNPERYIFLWFKKFLSFTFIDIESTYPNYYSLFHIVPKIIISITTFLSAIMLFNFRLKLHNFFILYYFLNIGLFSIFFILPRYSLSLLPVQIILSIFLIKKINFVI